LVGCDDQKKIYVTLDDEITATLQRISTLRAEDFIRQSKRSRLEERDGEARQRNDRKHRPGE
jgi:hypothetical protein